MIYITDSMTAAELDSDGACFLSTGKDGKPEGITWRVTRVARGSGTSVREVEEMLCQYRMMANMAKQAGGKNGWMQTIQKMQAAAGGRGRGANGQPTPAQIQAMQVRAFRLSQVEESMLTRGYQLSFLRPLCICSSARCLPACSSRCSARCAGVGCRR